MNAKMSENIGETFRKAKTMLNKRRRSSMALQQFKEIVMLLLCGLSTYP